MITNYCQSIPHQPLRETFWACPRCGTRRVHIMSSKDGILCLGPDCGFAPFVWEPGRTAPAKRVIPPPLEQPKLGMFSGIEAVMFRYYATRAGRKQSSTSDAALKHLASHIETRLAARISIIEGRMPTAMDVARFGHVTIHPSGQRDYQWRGRTILVVSQPDASGTNCTIEDVGL